MPSLVVGATGFVGRAIACRLLARGLPVRGTRRRTSNTLLLRKLPVEQVIAPLEDAAALERAMQGCSTVFFAAGHYPRTSLDLDKEVAVARRGAANVVAAARAAGVHRLIVTGSVATVGREAPPPGSVYHAVKHAIDDEIERGLAAPGPAAPRTVTIHAGGCIGEGDVKAATGFLVVGVASGALREYVEGRVSFLDVDDVAEAHVRAALLPEPRRSYVLAGHEIAVSDLVAAIAAALGVRAAPRALAPEAAAVEALRQEERWAAREGPRPSLPREWVDIVRHWLSADSSAALEELGLALTPLDASIRRACAWYARHGYIPRTEGKDR